MPDKGEVRLNEGIEIESGAFALEEPAMTIEYQHVDHVSGVEVRLSPQERHSLYSLTIAMSS